MELHPLASRFADVAGNYERGRPEYPPAVIGALMAETGLSAGDPVADLAAGTGKLTRALAAAGLDVVGIEPLAAMRDVLAGIVGANRAVEGVAEAIPLPDGSQRAVTVADGFHWFDGERALADIARVLAPGGSLALLATIPDWSGASWSHELGSLLSEARPDHPYFDGPSWEEAIVAVGGWSRPREIRVTADLPARGELLGDYLLSMSWVAGMEVAEREALVAHAEELVREGETPDELPVHFRIAITTPA
jgi:SAM-dependent methyltransferase